MSVSLSANSTSIQNIRDETEDSNVNHLCSKV